MRPRRGERGVTLVEILLALLVMVLGIIGILALFPLALQASKESVEETQAGITAESVAQALTNAVRFGTYDNAKGRYRIVLSHDLESPGGEKRQYAFWMPKFIGAGGQAEDWFHYPGANPDPPAADGLKTYMGTPIGASTEYAPEALDAFSLAGDPWIKDSVTTVRNTNDPSDPYDQFAFSFSVMKINTMAYLLTMQKPGGGNYTEADLEGMCKLYEFRINCFRVLKSSSGGGTGTTTTTTEKRLIAQTTFRVTVR